MLSETGRVARKTRFSGDFKKYDLDIVSDDSGGDDNEEERKQRKKKSMLANRKTKECPGCGAMVSSSVKECGSCDYRFTSKALLMATSGITNADESSAIRDRFLFEPEREEDGSLVIERILGRRFRGESTKKVNSLFSNSTAQESKHDYEYLVKYRSLSYLHVQWLSASEIDAMNDKSKKVLQRYLNKLDRGEQVDEDGEIDPTYLEVEKILDVKEQEVMEVQDTGEPPANVINFGMETTVASNVHMTSLASTNSLNSADVDPTATEMEAIGENDAGGSRYTKRVISTESLETTVKTASQRFKHVERCRKVLEKISDDPYAHAFYDPVDTDAFPDYTEIVSQPMSLSEVEEKLNNGDYNKFGCYRDFANDMRLIWSNCKKYNLYKSQIWYSAHTLNMLFERLFQAWVTSFHQSHIDFDEPVGRPWESACRSCLREDNDDKIILCDHCDAAHHIYCLRPMLHAVPDGNWYCPRCTGWFERQQEMHGQIPKIYSASTEDEARSYVEKATNRVIASVLKKKYLVKWRGLSYHNCTWETEIDINDDIKIKEFHLLNDTPPDEPPLTQAEIGIELSKDHRAPILPAKDIPNSIKDLDATIYAQIRAFHFLKFNRRPPDALLNECGAPLHSHVAGNRTDMLLPNFLYEDAEKCKIANANSSIKNENDSANPSPVKSSEIDPKMEVDNDNNDTSASKAKSLDKSLKWFHPIPKLHDIVFNEVADVLSNVVYSVARGIRPDPYPARPRLPEITAVPGEIEVCIPKLPNKPINLPLGNFDDYALVMQLPVINVPDHKGYVENFAIRCQRIRAGDVLVAINGLYVKHLSFKNVIKLLQSCTSPYIYLRFYRCPHDQYGKLDVEGVGPTDYITNYLDQKVESYSYKPHVLRSQYHGVYPIIDSNTNLSSIKNVKRWKAEVQVVDGKAINLGEFSEEIKAAHAYDKYIKSLHDETRHYNFNGDGTLTKSCQLLQKIVLEEYERNEERLTSLKELSSHVVKDSNAMEVSEPNMLSPEKNNAAAEVSDDENFNDYDSQDLDSELASSEHDSDQDEEAGSDDEWIDSGDDDEWKPTAVKEIEQESDGPLGRLLRAVKQTPLQPLTSEWSNHILELGSSGGVIKKVQQVDMASNAVIRLWDSVNAAARVLNIQIEAINKALKGQQEMAGGFRWRWQFVKVNSMLNGNNEDDDLDEDNNNKDDSWKAKLYKKSLEYKNGGTLRDYQVEGLNWLLRCWYGKRSSILADEMGLGKTIQVITFLNHLFEVDEIRGPFLICVPLSTLEHWRREAEGWTNMNVCLYHDSGGGPSSSSSYSNMRDIIREYLWYYSGRSRRLLKFHLLITTYDDLIKDYEELADIPWRAVVVDEAQRIRQINSKIADCMRSVVTKGLNAYGYQHRILMTGTPLQNNTAELFSLLNFIEPAKFPDAEKFADRFGDITTQEQVEALQRRIAPHLLRRVKEDVAKDIPPKEETIIDVELTTVQKQYYRAIFEKNHAFLMQSMKGNMMPKLMNIQMELRKCCNHPWLIHGVEPAEMEKLTNRMKHEGQDSFSRKRGTTSDVVINRDEFERRRMIEGIIPTSGKMVLVDKLLPKLREEGHKVLIFSQMVIMIDIIQEYCEFRKYPCEVLHGSVSGNDRQKSIDRFNKDPNSFVFLLSTRAGGVGINLTAADTVIIFDSDWNPQNDVQAMARCHRIGQTKSVTIYRLITRKSFEAEMFERASKKLGLEHAVLGSRTFTDEDFDNAKKQEEKMTAKEMEQLLREGAYAVLLEDDEEVKAFCEQDIEAILAQRTHTIITEGGGDDKKTESWLNKKKNSKTRKSLFTGDSSLAHAEIDVNDPDFWKKVLPDLVSY